MAAHRRTDPDSARSERLVVSRLRTMVAVLTALSVAAAALGYFPRGFMITDRDYVDHIVPAGGNRLAAYLLLLMMPGLMVVQRPRWREILLWILWAVPLTAATLALANDGSRCAYPAQHLLGRADCGYEWAWPLPAGWMTYTLVGTVLFGIAVVIPLIRSTHRTQRSPRAVKLPAARIHRP